MHGFVFSRGHARGLVLMMLAGVALVALLLRPLASGQSDGGSAAAGQAAPPGQAQSKEQVQGKEKEEENGGDIVFHVLDKKQKYSVLYSHEKHLSAGLKCEECHGKTEKDAKVFQKSIGANKFRMKDITEGRFCGTCHTEKPAADVTHPSFAPKKNCAKCHSVRVREEK